MVKDRDVSEKIALGLPNPGGRDEQFDQRLFNQSRVSTSFNIYIIQGMMYLVS